MKLHIISFDVPWPADYGGVIDVYNRLEALKQAGVDIILHAFDYGRGRADHLEEVCNKVYYYKRKNRIVGMLRKEPMIVNTRSSEELLERLKQDRLPILLEGQHTTALLDHPDLSNRKKLVRIHNVEHEYYMGLANNSIKGARSAYFKKEASKLKRHESILQHADQLMCITEKDQAYYNDKFGNATYLPVAISCLDRNEYEQQDYILYHGNLSVPENSSAVKWLLKNVCSDVQASFVFAGKSPSDELRGLISVHSNTKLVADPSNEEMQVLINSAKAHVFYTSQATGIKIKLLRSLCTNAPIICNGKMVEGTGLEKACHVVDEPTQYVSALNNAMLSKVFNDEKARKELLATFDYGSHAEKLLSFLQ